MIRTLIVALFPLLVTGCSHADKTAAFPAAGPSDQISQPAAEPEPSTVHRPFPIVWASSGAITEGDFTARLRTHKVNLEGQATELSFATLERNGHVILTFDGVRNPIGNETRVAFAQMTGPESVLAVEQESNREWRVWIAAFSPHVRTIFDSQDWFVGRGLDAEDLDGDGKAELRQSSLHYWFFDDLNNVNSPFPEAIFEFDRAKGRYLPANPHFSAEATDAIVAAQKLVTEIEGKPNDAWKAENLRGAVTGVVIQLCYSRRDAEAWAYFDLHYSSPDRDERRRILQERLAGDPFYRALVAGPAN